MTDIEQTALRIRREMLDNYDSGCPLGSDVWHQEFARRLLAVKAEQVDGERVAQLVAHRACCGVEHDPANGKLHGYCVVCGVPWPCEYAGKPPIPTDKVLVPREPTEAMVEAYLLANASYWVEHDKLPSPIGKWRSGTAKEATKAGYRAMLAASKEKS